MPDRAHTVTIDPELQPGARNAIRDCLRLKPEERITIITDEATRDIAAALQAKSKKSERTMPFSFWKNMRRAR